MLARRCVTEGRAAHVMRPDCPPTGPRSQPGGNPQLMTARFAGSRSVGERRRRRLATGEDAAAPPPRSARGQSRAAMRLTRRVVALPLRKLIPRRAWKLWGLWLLIVVCGGGVLALSHWAAQLSHPLATVAGRTLGPAAGRAMTIFSGFLLALCGQLAMLIRCVRARSTQDFGGRYAVWNWGAFAGFAAALILTSGLHHAWGDVASLLWGLEETSEKTFAWLVPAVVSAGCLLWALLRDMDGCRSSTAVVQLAACCGCVAALLELEAFGVVPEPARQLSQNATCGFACAALFLGLLLHAQFVIYHSADPPPPRASILRRIAVRLRELADSARAAATPDDKPAAADAKATGAASSRRAPTSTRGPRRASRKPAETADEEAAAEVAEEATLEPGPEPTNTEEVAKASPVPRPATAESRRPEMERKPQPPAPQPACAATPEPGLLDDDDADGHDGPDGRTLRIDAAHDRDQLKGLSKRERRKLQKQWRQEGRGGQDE